jgi:hypothetical protein
MMTPISIFIEDYPLLSKYVNATAFFTTSILLTINSFFKFNEKMTKHFNMVKRYMDVISDINSETEKNKYFFIRMQTILDNLYKIEPLLENDDENENIQVITIHN